MATADGSMEEGATSPSAVDWSNLPGDLLGLIRWRIVYLRGRIRFAAVCTSWRAAASQHPAPPALPLLVLSLHVWETRKKRFYCPEEDMVLHVPVPSPLRSTRICGTHDGGWIAAIATPASVATLVIANLFSSAEVALSTKQRNVDWQGDRGQRQLIRKIVFSDVPTSSSCVLAALTTDHHKVALCRVGCRDGGWTIYGCHGESFVSVVFQHGELYGLTQRSEKLFKFDIDRVEEEGAPVITAAYPLNVRCRSGPKTENWFTTYIFGLHGKLAMAVMAPWSQNHKPFFKVFQLAVTKDAHDYEWKELPTLGDGALFSGQTCSPRVVHVQVGRRGVVEKNHIYYSKYHSVQSKGYREFNEEVSLGRSEHGDNIYCCKDPKSDGHGDGKDQIPSVGYYMNSCMDCPMWCFPPDF